MKTAKKTTKTTAKKTAKKAAKKEVPFSPAPDLNILQRGGEFLSLKKKGMKPAQIIALYATFGINVSVPTYYNAVRIATAPDFVQKVIASGELKASKILPFLKRKKTIAKLRKEMGILRGERKERIATLKEAGFKGASKVTKNRIVHMVGQNLQKIRRSGALKDARGKAVLDFIKALEQGKTADQLLSLFSGK